MMRLAAIRTAVLVMLALSACNKAPPLDSVGSYGPWPATSEVAAGQGGLVTQAATDAYFYAFDGAGKQVGSAHVNALLPLKPGEYQLKVNNSVHMSAVESATLTKCPTGGVLVNGSTDDYYHVLDDAAKELASPHIRPPPSSFQFSYQTYP